MKLRKSGNRIIDDSFIKPDHEIATFTDLMTDESKEVFILEHNFGQDVLQELFKHGDSLHIDEVSKIVKQLFDIAGKLSDDKYKLRRKMK